MQLLIISYPSFTIEVDSNKTIKELKEKIETKKNIDTNIQSLYFAAKRLNNQQLLKDYNIQN